MAADMLEGGIMEETLAFVMAGGQGERLRPLTDVRAKPAVPFGGNYRIIDLTLSNCLNSGIRRIYVLTQYKSHSLSNHLKTGWNLFSRRLDQFIDEVPAQQQLGHSWYQGTADAIRQNMHLLEHRRPRFVLILSGDHIYKMDYRLLQSYHGDKRASLTVACARVPAEDARGNLGVMEVDDDERIIGFEEKPMEPKTIPGTSDCLASMGIYLFEVDCLQNSLANDLADFGKDVIPLLLQQGTPVYAYDFAKHNKFAEWEYITYEGARKKELVPVASDCNYWRDVGTLEQYWQANLDLVQPSPKFNVYSERFALYSSPDHFPAAKFVHESPGRTGMAFNSIIADGVIVSGATVRNSVIGCGAYLHSWALVENSVLFGGGMSGGIITETDIGRHCRIRNAIIDKNVRLSENTCIGFDRVEDEMRGLKVVPINGGNDHIVVVPKDFSI
jgi:glucose-1-phosphate adenylyltransferase